MGRERLRLDVGIYGSCRTGGGPRAVVGRIGESVVVGLLRTVIIGRSVAVCPGMDGIGGTRGDGIMEGGRRVGRGRVAVTRVNGTIS